MGQYGITFWLPTIVKNAGVTNVVLRGLRLDRAFMTLTAAENGLGMCLESTVLVREYLQQGRLVCPFGDMAIAARAHHLAVPKSKESLQSVQVVLDWIKSFIGKEESSQRMTAVQSAQQKGKIAVIPQN